MKKESDREQRGRREEPPNYRGGTHVRPHRTRKKNGGRKKDAREKKTTDPQGGGGGGQSCDIFMFLDYL